MLARRWSLLVVLTCSYGLGAFGMLGVSPLSPALMQGFGLSRLDVAFIVPSVYVGGLLFSLPGGHLADQWGVRPTLLGALALGGVGLLAAAPLGAALPAFSAGIAAYGWVGIYFISSAEAGGATQSGLLSGVSFAAIVIGLLAGAPTFGLVLQAFDSYGASWTVFAGLSGVVALVVVAFGAAIHRECQPTLAR